MLAVKVADLVTIRREPSLPVVIGAVLKRPILGFQHATCSYLTITNSASCGNSAAYVTLWHDFRRHCWLNRSYKDDDELFDVATTTWHQHGLNAEPIKWPVPNPTSNRATNSCEPDEMQGSFWKRGLSQVERAVRYAAIRIDVLKICGFSSAARS